MLWTPGAPPFRTFMRVLRHTSAVEGTPRTILSTPHGLPRVACNQLAGTNFTLEDSVPANPNARLAVQDWVQTTTTATTGAFAAISAINWVENVAAFKPAGGAAAPKCNPIALMGVGCY